MHYRFCLLPASTRYARAIIEKYTRLRSCAFVSHDTIFEHPLNLNILLSWWGIAKQDIFSHCEWTWRCHHRTCIRMGSVSCTCFINRVVAPIRLQYLPGRAIANFRITVYSITACIAWVVLFWIWMQMGGAAHQRCNTLAKLLCSIYKIQKISQILIEIGCTAKTHHMCGQVIATRCDL